MKLLLLALCVLSSSLHVASKCPFSGLDSPSFMSSFHRSSNTHSVRQLEQYSHALKKIDWEAVKADIKHLLTDSQDFWPADYGHYGGFFIRQAWHCSGSYRSFDGRGGCDGGRQRFDPERSWDDNTNLDKAKTLLWPIKEKYGIGLSWGDLIILAGTTAIESMGGPVLGFCAGRIDDFDGRASLLLGPTEEQAESEPCPVNGECKTPFGTTTIGLIYVNPEGPMGVPNPAGSALEVRDTFGRMNMNDSETVSLIGGGHAFGKTHGACPKGPGPSPKEDPANPWPGLCGTGKGADTFTSGFEGPWSTTPTKWSNNYFKELANNDWEVKVGPGGKHQWATASLPNIMMLTSDISLLHDPAGEFQKYVDLYSRDLAALEKDFSHAWYKLTTRDMGPVTRCAGPYVPPPQEFQNPLPSPPSKLADFKKVREAIRELITSNHNAVLVPDVANGKPYYGAIFVDLSYQCAASFRSTDFQGGCNGARIRFSPEKDWESNKNLDRAITLLKTIKDRFGEELTWADLIVLAGTVALEESGSKPLPFCGGRSDAIDGKGSKNLRAIGNPSATADEIREAITLSGLSTREYIALSGRLRSGQLLNSRGYELQTWTSDVGTLSNSYFKILLSETWEKVESVDKKVNKVQYKAKGKELFLLPADLVLRFDADFLSIAQEFASDNEMFLHTFAAAWTKLMNIDRFDGPTGSVCRPYGNNHLINSVDSSYASNPVTNHAAHPISLIIGSVGVVALVLGVTLFVWTSRKASQLSLRSERYPLLAE